MNRMLVLSTLATLGIAGTAQAQSLATPAGAARAGTASATTTAVTVVTPPTLTAIRTLHSPPAFAHGYARCTILNATGEPIRIKSIEVRGSPAGTPPIEQSSSCPSYLSGERLLPNLSCHVTAHVHWPDTVACRVQYESPVAGMVGSFSFRHLTAEPFTPQTAPEYLHVILPLQHTP